MTKLYNEANESILVIIKWQASGWVCTMEKEECCMPALMSLSLSLKFVIFAAAIFVSNIVQSLTGFAGVMLSIPPSMLLFGPDKAIDVKLYSLVSPQIIGPVYGRASRTSSRRQKECGRCRW